MPIRPYHYQLTAPIPEIEGEPYDILVWRYPQVYLTRRTVDLFGKDSVVVIKLRVFASYWWFLFSKYEERLAPLDPDAPPVQALAGSIPKSRRPRRTPRRSGNVDPCQAEALEVEFWPGPPDHEPPPRRPVLVD